MTDQRPPQKRKPGVCIPWEEKEKEYAKLTGDKELIRRIHEQIDFLAYLYIWHCLLSF